MKKYIPFYVGLLFLIIPIYFSYVGEYPKIMIWISIIFGLAYLGMIHLTNKKILYVLWAILIVYITFTTVFVAPFNILFIAYCTNLIAFKLNPNIKSYYFMTFFISTTFLFLYVVSSPFVDISVKIPLIIMLIFYLVIFIIQRQRLKNEYLRQETIKKNEYINVLAAENERNRIATDLHDSLGHVFVMLSLKTELTIKLLEKNNIESAKKELLEINNINKKSINDVRNIVTNLKYRTIDEELESIKNIFNISNIKYNITNNCNLSTFPSIIQSNVTMILREAVNNIIKHSGASECNIEFINAEKGIYVIINDNGIGFKNINGDELLSLKNRLQNLDGTIKITNLVNPTTVEAFIPYTNH